VPGYENGSREGTRSFRVRRFAYSALLSSYTGLTGGMIGSSG
jgi:hypothetical protein